MERSLGGGHRTRSRGQGRGGERQVAGQVVERPRRKRKGHGQEGERQMEVTSPRGGSQAGVPDLRLGWDHRCWRSLRQPVRILQWRGGSRILPWRCADGGIYGQALPPPQPDGTWLRTRATTGANSCARTTFGPHISGQMALVEGG